jgi:hypothetical protein
MRVRLLLLLFTLLAWHEVAAQQWKVGIAPTFDAGSDIAGPLITQHLPLSLYANLLKTGNYFPSLLAPGGVYSPFDTSWILDYVRDRQDLDLLLLTTLKPSAKGAPLLVDVSLLNAHTGEVISSWSVNSDPTTKKGFLKAIGSSLQAGLLTPAAFVASPLGQAVERVAGFIRDQLPAKTAALPPLKDASPQPVAAPAPSSKSCLMHTRITYAYKHAVSRSHSLLVNDLDESTTIQDGVSSFLIAEGPILLQFTLNDAPYSMSKQSLYQLSTLHGCAQQTLMIDIGKQGDAHFHWE